MNKAFTLIELIFVIAIIAILSAVALPKYERSVRLAEMTEALTIGKTVYEAALRYKATSAAAPTDFNQLDIKIPGATGTGNTRTKGKFSYQLGDDYVKAVCSSVGYELRFFFPTRDENGVYAPVGCCPNSQTATEICKNIGRTYDGEIDDMNGCTEIK